MPTISNALKAFRNLLDVEYHFSISSQKKLYNIILTFEKSDFYHLSGFQYLIDIDIPKSTVKLYEKIDNKDICDIALEKSTYYIKSNDNYANVKSRIFGLQYIKEYLESKSLVIKYIKSMNKFSKIDADFLIKSTLNHDIAYIFIRKRSKGNSWCVCSFFINSETEYFGIKAYWLYKSIVNIPRLEEVVLLDKFSSK